MSLWPSISGVALRIRSIRAWTLGSIGWAWAMAGLSVMAAARRSNFFPVIRKGLGSGHQPRNLGGLRPGQSELMKDRWSDRPTLKK